MNITNITVAVIGALTAITGAYFTANTTANSKINTVDTKVEVLQERQTLQYKEVSGTLERIEKKLDELK